MPRSSLFNDTFRAALLSASVVLASAAAWAQNSDPADFNQLDWTGRPESPVTARKEAGAALVEGRRECARQREERAACLKKVQEDYVASLKRADMRTAKR